MHPACPNKKQNHLQNCLLRRTQFWVRKAFSKPASLKRASLVVRCQSTSSHGARRCFAQCNPVPALLECHLATGVQCNQVKCHACLRTPESQRSTGSPPVAGLCAQTDEHSQNSGRHPCRIATNRPPGRCYQRARLLRHSHSLRLHKESVHSIGSPCQHYRT